MSKYKNIREEELKNKVGQDFFSKFDHTEILWNIDFTVFPKQDPSSISYLALTEFPHKQLAYIKGKQIITLADYARSLGESGSSIANKAKRQTIRAFREKRVWKMGA